jgi:hypothetical protein
MMTTFFSEFTFVLLDELNTVGLGHLHARF